MSKINFNYKTLDFKTKVMMFLIIFLIILYISDIVIKINTYQLALKVKDIGQVNQSELRSLEKWGDTIKEVFVYSRILFLLIFFIWVYRAYSNLRTFGVDILHSPGKAIAYFFIPVLNFFKPVAIVREIVDNSISNIEHNSEKLFRASNFVTWWWMFFLGSQILLIISSNSTKRIDSIFEIEFYVVLSSISSLCAILSIILLVFIFRFVSKNQDETWETLKMKPEVDSGRKRAFAGLVS